MENPIIPEIVVDAVESPETTVNINLAEIIKIDQIIKDYEQLRNVVLSNLIDIKQLSDSVKSEIEMEIDFKLVDSWNNLIKTSNESLKILTESYKNISSVILAINKINSQNPKPENDTTQVKIENTADIIKRLKNETSGTTGSH